jgi:hypothetical protein
MSRKQDKEPLQQRVNDYLRGKKLSHHIDEPHEESIDAIFDLLQRAEEDLRVAQQTVARLKSELEKARS